MRIFVAVTVTAFMIFCGQTFAADANAPDTGDDANAVAATVNGVDIMEGVIEERLAPQLQQMQRQGQQLPPQFMEQYKQQLRERILDGLISQELLRQKVEEKDITVSEEEAIAEIEKMASQQQPPLSLEQFKQMISAFGRTFEEVKQQVKDGLAFQKLLEKQWAGEIEVTEEDARQYYDQNTQQFQQPKQVKARHILIKPDPNADDPNAAEAEAKEKAQELADKIVEEGADFAEMAKEHSEGPSAPQGGDLGFFAKESMVPPFAEAAFAMDEGQISDVVKTRFGYHVIKVEQIKPAQTTSFEEAKDQIMQTVEQRQQSQIVQEYVNELKEQATIEYAEGYEPRQTPQMPTAPAQPQQSGNAN